MGLVFDSSVLISAERSGLNLAETFRGALTRTGNVDEPFVVSVLSISELAHGLARARSEAQRLVRQQFLDDLFASGTVYPVTPGIARRAGIWSGELAAKGLHPGLPDLLIASTAVELGFRIATANVRHFAMIPGLEIVTA